ncbi:hypothetical protein FK220_016085 [Flavobacteriaceae bacterium TP-CH-4]|uniref:Uncharacterized protein n=1 Tax=Pelagihabitans pacificus TaxID=2696054 RepID=A0A967E830_9FLAO|nr:hypothetical protein [Pelagihabitans pacificus]NHF60874.1 hypothetical protein [Pelagihabitans pacificus]
MLPTQNLKGFTKHTIQMGRTASWDFNIHDTCNIAMPALKSTLSSGSRVWDGNPRKQGAQFSLYRA